MRPLNQEVMVYEVADLTRTPCVGSHRASGHPWLCSMRSNAGCSGNPHVLVEESDRRAIQTGMHDSFRDAARCRSFHAAASATWRGHLLSQEREASPAIHGPF